ncbi:hypothetical protein SeLEV6574_g04490 [Synchytrium endobioticum]|uniref:Uncharacterized protein n=1 Tax=Synchytrium endobioticum TaxID=286115 RepID=A0A507CZ12_9FUNG|nr:hypothetical protein SeLEV6574_g04490 [Synchytrium endobioticum]
MVFLSASAAGNSEQPNLNEEALQADFKNFGAYANAHELLDDPDMFFAFLRHVKRMAATFELVYANLGPKLERSDYSVVKEDLNYLKYLRIFVTTERLPWVLGGFRGPKDLSGPKNISAYRDRYRDYSNLFKRCVQLFRKHMTNVVLQFEDPRESDLDMKTVIRIISIELHIWGNRPEKWTEPYRSREHEKYLFSRYSLICSQWLLWIHQEGYTSLLDESLKALQDEARQGTTNHGNQNSVVTSGVAEPIASHQLLPLFTSDGNAGTSYGYTYADRPELENIGDILDTSLSLSSRANEPIASNQQWPLFPSDGNAGTPYGYTYANTPEFGYNSIEGTTRFAHPPTYDPAGPSSSYAGTGTPYPPTYGPAGPSSSYAGTGTPNTLPTSDSAGPSGCPTDSSGFIKWL